MTAEPAPLADTDLVTQLRRRERWLLALAAVRSVMLSGASPTESMDLIAERCATLTEADAVVLLLGDPSGVLRVWAVAGPSATIDSGPVSGPAVSDTDPWAAAVRAALGCYRVGDLPAPTHAGLREIWLEAESALIAAIPEGTHRGGVVICLRRAGRAPFAPDQQPELVGLAEQAAIALDIAERQRHEHHAGLVAERERIARDLHDHVIQRLFAVGLSLQGALKFVDDERGRDRVDNAVIEIDEAIADLRSSIFELRTDPGSGRTSLRRRLTRIVGSLGGEDGPRLTLRSRGPVDTLVTPAMAQQVEAVVREAVSNAVRHARATTVTATVDVGRDITVTVTDDGVGIGPDVARSGLKNLAARAEACGGELGIDAGARGGSVLTWRVPLPDGPSH